MMLFTRSGRAGIRAYFPLQPSRCQIPARRCFDHVRVAWRGGSGEVPEVRTAFTPAHSSLHAPFGTPAACVGLPLSCTTARGCEAAASTDSV